MFVNAIGYNTLSFRDRQDEIRRKCTHGSGESPFANLMDPRPLADTIHVMYGRVARYIAGVLDAPGENDGYTGVYILPFIDVYLPNANAYFTLSVFVSFNFEKRCRK